MTTPARLTGLLLATASFLVLGAASAVADAPTTWEEEAGRSTLDNLLVFVGGTVVLFVVVALFGLLTARNNYVPPPPSTDLEKAGGNAPAHH